MQMFLIVFVRVCCVRCLVCNAEVFRSHYVPIIVTLYTLSDHNPD